MFVPADRPSFFRSPAAEKQVKLFFPTRRLAREARSGGSRRTRKPGFQPCFCSPSLHRRESHPRHLCADEPPRRHRYERREQNHCQQHREFRKPEGPHAPNEIFHADLRPSGHHVERCEALPPVATAGALPVSGERKPIAFRLFDCVTPSAFGLSRRVGRHPISQSTSPEAISRKLPQQDNDASGIIAALTAIAEGATKGEPCA